jgi:hypothetical protein
MLGLPVETLVIVGGAVLLIILLLIIWGVRFQEES